MNNDATADDGPPLTRREIVADLELLARQLIRLAQDAELLADGVREAAVALRERRR